MNKEALLKSFSNLLDAALGSQGDNTVAHVESETELVKSVLPEERRAMFVVLEPQSGDETTDLHGDTYSAKEVEKACANFNTHSMKANLYHMVETEHAVIEQSFITPAPFTTEDGRVIKAGTWLQWWHFPEGNPESDLLWDAVKAGDITGVSIGARAAFEEIQDGES